MMAAVWRLWWTASPYSEGLSWRWTPWVAPQRSCRCRWRCSGCCKATEGAHLPRVGSARSQSQVGSAGRRCCWAMVRGGSVLHQTSGKSPGSQRTDHSEEASRTSLANEMVLLACVCGSARFRSFTVGAPGCRWRRRRDTDCASRRERLAVCQS